MTPVGSGEITVLPTREFVLTAAEAALLAYAEREVTRYVELAKQASQVAHAVILSGHDFPPDTLGQYVTGANGIRKFVPTPEGGVDPLILVKEEK